MIVRSLLANELKNTNSVMYDLRGNSGETKAWQETEPNSRFTNVFFPNSVKSANTLGQAYLRPMGILNDAKCYSACEVFSGSIQGHDAGTIFGEDKQTGGGGATVVELDPWLIRASPDDFQKFPFSQELTSGSITYTNTLTVSVTQTVRTGRYNGQTIEDVGIETEIIVRPQWSDLQPDPTTNTQYDRIAERLARTGQENGQSVQVLKTKRNVRTIPTNDKYMKISTRGFTFTGTSDSLDSTNPQLLHLRMAGTT
ncbi:hypothetical protein BASA50_009275 [Batrachochytrium salamandrivorans]|uniref:Tail specific protease domain-containing protein n=1 Tax=Batrachochytrium salamandrivorans TaxID=1357716 RepID=A0ABQ8F2V6_9FUNG|nr:hypothetical protein BASA50_009275 [Batrachochytrium salamandrivorans]